MKRILLPILFVASTVGMLFSCVDKKVEKPEEVIDTLYKQVVDTAMYGKCGDGTSMHNLQLVADDGKATDFVIDEEQGSEVLGGLFSGDKLSVTYFKADDELIINKVVNLTTLLGRWTSLDRNFSILEGGVVESNVQSESLPYTSWSSVNGLLVLNADTFSILSLGADSLALENDKGVFVFKRMK